MKNENIIAALDYLETALDRAKTIHSHVRSISRELDQTAQDLIQHIEMARDTLREASDDRPVEFCQHQRTDEALKTMHDEWRQLQERTK
jgi:hypothetical protein